RKRNEPMSAAAVDRRRFLQASAVGLLPLRADKPADKEKPAEKKKPTKFQVGCMTLVYAHLPFDRALKGLKSAGYRYVALYNSHAEAPGSKKRVPVIAGDAAPAKAKEVGKRCRDLGLTPVMMFGPAPENVPAMKKCIAHASAAGIGQVLTMGRTGGNEIKVWVKNFKELAPVARDAGVMIVVKQHGGNTGTGAACAAVTREVASESVKVCYDAGNVMDYHKIDPLPDIKKCSDEVRSFAIKDHRTFPRDEDCGAGFGEIDHYRVLAPVAFNS